MGHIADDTMDGSCCAECGVYFAKAHGYPVLCKDCHESYGDTEPVYPVAIERELE